MELLQHINYNPVDILGYPVSNLTMDETVEKVDEFIASGHSHQITVINANKVFLADKYPQLATILKTSDLVIAEQAIVIAGKILKRPLKERVSGVELMERLLTEAPTKKYRNFFLGASIKIVARLRDVCKEKYPGLNIVGYLGGYFKPEEEPTLIAKIRMAKPGILFVALGSPKQEFWIRRNLEQLGVPVCLGVGGSFDLLAGYKKRAPVWMQCGLEWIYRLMQDPRLWKRYFKINPIFVWKVLKAKLSFVSSKSPVL